MSDRAKGILLKRTLKFSTFTIYHLSLLLRRPILSRFIITFHKSQQTQANNFRFFYVTRFCPCLLSSEVNNPKPITPGFSNANSEQLPYPCLWALARLIECASYKYSYLYLHHAAFSSLYRVNFSQLLNYAYVVSPE